MKHTNHYQLLGHLDRAIQTCEELLFYYRRLSGNEADPDVDKYTRCLDLLVKLDREARR